ncbi:MAG: undecaprenyl/decaprenyl-phosphate alpha-N-acetylglucosaminyl 1-phosphate transferase [Campylobacteraceae bacterium]|jgi:UDP-N-acetylmuramyl pentapeptide phosphotransferase/UDP-N-acetylglucosamine-1-phosphate transferase|nr:undecaprenyl/decaprenyl-phosphate alpha-N-acetylglucosaminyl 1-phosphate transferase [Campylobacteraceae bacterium]
MYIAAPLIAFVISFLICLCAIYFTEKHNIFLDSHDSLKPQKVHNTSTSRAGGLGIFCGAILMCADYFPFALFFLLAGFVTFAGGLVEDFRGTLSPKIRLLIQSLSAVLGIFLFNALIFDIGIPWHLPFAISVLFTIFAVVGSINAVNIIDGFNGLASGISIMVLISLCLCAYMVGDMQILYISLIVLCASLGFLVLNFPKGKIFLGDGGAYFLGFCIVEIAILISQRHEQISSWFVLCIMIYPVYEVLFSAYRRKRKGLSPLYPDKMHLHTVIFRKITKNNYKTSILIWILAAPFIFIPLLYMWHTKLLAATVLLFILLYNLIYFRLVKSRMR